MILIRSFQIQDAIAISQLHQSFLRTPLKGYIGLNLLRLYYSALSYSNGGIIFVAHDGDHIVGYICGLWDNRSVRQNLVKNYWLQLFWFGGLSLFSQKGIFKNIWKRIIARDKEVSVTEPELMYELRPIVVHPDVRGSGVAAKLGVRLYEDALSRGYRAIFLYTEEDNLAAQKFYLNQGFKFIKKEFHNGQMAYKMELQIG